MNRYLRLKSLFLFANFRFESVINSINNRNIGETCHDEKPKQPIIQIINIGDFATI